ncbi:MAG: hypothetical protein HZA01_10305 [Nitrospinae bacterium]|nr:hypothetical protein [Nitrospinota bacterium]
MSSIKETSNSSTTAACNGLMRTGFGSAYVADLSTLKGKARFESIFQAHRKDHVSM